MPERIQRNRSKGWRMPENTIYVGRPTKWGNPYTVGWHGDNPPEYWDAKKCVELFRFTMCPVDGEPGVYTDFEMAEIDLSPLRGKNLGCWCPVGEPCHADVLLELANEEPRP